MNDSKDFQNNLKLLRIVAGWTVEELAKLTGSTRQTITNIESNKTALTKKMYIVITSVFNDTINKNNNIMLKNLLDIISQTPTSLSSEVKEKLLKKAAMISASYNSGLFSQETMINEWSQCYSKLTQNNAMTNSVFNTNFFEQLKETIPLISSIVEKGERIILNELSKAEFVIWAKPDLSLVEALTSNGETNIFPINNGIVEEPQPSIDSIDACLRKYLETSNYSSTLFAIDKCNVFLIDSILWKQALSSYIQEEYHAAAIVFTVLVDNLLSTYLEDKKVTSFKTRITYLINEVKNTNNNVPPAYLLDTLFKSIIAFAEPHDFNASEPSCINRNWLLHGKTTRVITKLDCIKLIHMIYGIILVAQSL